jgi:Domain of unknown function (DUF4440)
MRKAFLVVSLLLAFTHCHSQQTSSEDLAKLKAMNAKFIHNFVTNDTISHTKIIHDRFVCITDNGRTLSRKEYMNKWLHGFDGFLYWDYRDEDIKIFGCMALVHSQNKFVVVREGKEISGMSMYTDTYVKENGEWKCVQAQLVNVASENYAGDETIVRKYDYRRK